MRKPDHWRSVQTLRGNHERHAGELVNILSIVHTRFHYFPELEFFGSQFQGSLLDASSRNAVRCGCVHHVGTFKIRLGFYLSAVQGRGQAQYDFSGFDFVRDCRQFIVANWSQHLDRHYPEIGKH